MSTNPTKIMLVNCQNCHVFLTPSTHFVQPLAPGAKSITCGRCKTIIAQPWPHSHRKKKAVICGISYQNSSIKLEGSMEDAKCMKKLLIEHFNFSKSDIIMLTEDKETNLSPTKDKLLWALHWLRQGCQPGDSLVFYYSGHGLRLRNYRRSTEDDGYNETLCPMDFETRGMIFDDEINEVIVGHLPCGVKLHAIIDSRHRKSVLDLRYLYRKNRSTGQYELENYSPPSGVLKGTSGGVAISFSRSVEVQTSAHTPLISKTTSTNTTGTTSTNTTSIVSMTSRFIKAIKDGHKATKDGHKAIKDGHKAIKDGRKQPLTYKSILDSMQLQNTINETVPNSGQEPILSACGPFNVYSPFTL